MFESATINRGYAITMKIWNSSLVQILETNVSIEEYFCECRQ